MDDYDAGFICNHSDHNGRYAFNQQPYIGLWNLSCLAQTLLPLAPKEELKTVLDAYMPVCTAHYQSSMRAKMGLLESQPDDETLVQDLLSLLQGSRVDYTRFFRELGDFSTLTQPSPLKGEAKGEGGRHSLRDWFLDPARFDGWAARYGERLRDECSRDEERRQRMNGVNPKYVLRNYLAQTAIENAQKKDFSEIDRLLTLVQDPFSEHPGMESYAAAPPNWGKHIMVSCSS